MHLLHSRNTWTFWESLFIPEAREPASAWTGSAAIGERLTTLWEQYQPLANERKKAEHKMSRKRQQLEIEQKINLWQDLKPYHARQLYAFAEKSLFLVGRCIM